MYTLRLVAAGFGRSEVDLESKMKLRLARLAKAANYRGTSPIGNSPPP
jgi:hypothetical protein